MTTREVFLDVFGKALKNRNAAVFAGAGLSRAAGFLDWKGLLRGVARELGLNIDTEADLVSLAQFHVNERGGRGGLNDVLYEEMSKNATVTRNHELLAQLPIETIWTTNYDKVIENAFARTLKRLDVKIAKEDIGVHMPGRDAVLYKMHGDASALHKAVITRDDYERYDDDRAPFSLALQSDLISKTFLFLGFSFADPNLDRIFARVRLALGSNRREHFTVMKRPSRSPDQSDTDFAQEMRRAELRLEDLRRYGIQTVAIDDYAELTGLLDDLRERHTRGNIFVSGSAHAAGPLGQARLEGLARQLGAEIIRRRYNLTSCFGQCVGGAVLLGAAEEVSQARARIEDRVILRPLPPGTPANMTRAQMKTRFRAELIGESGFAIFIAGNKLRGGSVVLADGCEEEFAIAERLGKYPIPIGVTGYVAEALWKQVTGNLSKYFAGKERSVEKHFQALGDAGKMDDELIAAVFGIVDAVLGR